ncbi:hypothetical protein B0H21DRAFT_894242 [Amylocystis lapponica]|nr:hypothetical protein B0H21DRAFT_894242 [Amylocystis lapponica]
MDSQSGASATAGLDVIEMAEVLLSKLREERTDISRERIKTLEDVLDSIAVAIHDIRSPYTSINRLPCDILYLIFSLVPAFVHHSGTPYCVQTHQLLPVTHVCRLWRSVALDRPLLWTSIYDSYRTGSEHRRREADIITQTLFLERAREAPLNVYLHDLQSRRAQYLLTLHGSRIQNLIIDDGARHSVRAHTFFAFSAPQLERFELLFAERAEPSAAFPLLFQGHAPRLRVLTLKTHYAGNWLPSNQFDSLVHLSLSCARDCNWHLSDFVSLLSRCPRLEELVLAQIGATLDENDHALPKVALNRLTRLVLTQLIPRFVGGLLRCLELPSALAVSVSGKYCPDPDSEEMMGHASMLQALSHLDVMNHLTTLQLTYSSIACPSLHLRGPSHLMTLEPSRLVALPDAHMHPLLPLLHTTLPVWSKIVEFWPWMASHEASTELIGSLSSLTKLVLCSDVLRWLRILSAVPLPFPLMSTLHIDVERDMKLPALAAALLDCAAVRAAHGHPVRKLLVQYGPFRESDVIVERERLEAAFPLVQLIPSDSRPRLQVPAGFREFHAASAYWPLPWVSHSIVQLDMNRMLPASRPANHTVHDYSLCCRRI